MRSPAERVQLPAELEGSLALVNEWLVKIAGGENPELDLRNLRAVLLNVLKMVKAEFEHRRGCRRGFRSRPGVSGGIRACGQGGHGCRISFRPPWRGADGKVLSRVADGASERKPECIRPEPGGVGDGALRSGGEQPGERANKRRSDGRSSTSEAPRVRGTSTGVKMRALRHSSTRGRG